MHLIMDIKKIANNIWKVALSLILGGAILYWMYRGFDFKQVEDVLLHKMSWTWMLLSFPFGISAQVFRGWRWKQSLEPLGEKARSSISIYSIFLSYALSLVIPRAGEFARCGVLKKLDDVSFPKALGTVITERAIDSLLVLLITALVFVMQIPVFLNFFEKTGTSMDSLLSQFTATGYIVTAICGIAVLILAHYLLKRLAIYNKVKCGRTGIADVDEGSVNDEEDWFLVIILFLIFFGIPIYLFIRYILEMLGIVKPRPKSNQRNQSRRRNNDDDWIPPFFMGGGGSSGGGFSGGSFGGGTFSGGGSGGGW